MLLHRVQAPWPVVAVGWDNSKGRSCLTTPSPNRESEKLLIKHEGRAQLRSAVHRDALSAERAGAVCPLLSTLETRLLWVMDGPWSTANNK